MLKKLEMFMRYKKYSVVIYMFLLVVITFMITFTRSTQAETKSDIEQVSFPTKFEQSTQTIFSTIGKEQVTDFFS